MKPSKELLGKMRVAVDGIEKVLRDDGLSSETQIADVKTFCWAMIELVFLLQKSVEDELSDLD
jgi:hypothetical protein